jgi:hypothetical protein
MPAHRGTWLKRCSECGKKYKPRRPQPGEFRMLQRGPDGGNLPLCNLIRCIGTQEEKDNFIVAKMEKALTRSSNLPPPMKGVWNLMTDDDGSTEWVEKK